MRQVKVRLQLAGTSFAALEDDAALAGTPRLTEERRLYFDTAGGALAAAGAGLCICQRAGRSVQVLELPGSNREWPVPGPWPVLEPGGPLLALLGEGARDLGLTGIATLGRREWPVAQGDATLELALVEGTLGLADRRVAIRDCEITLTAGPVAELFALAGRLAEAAPLRLSVVTVAQRGRMLAEPVPRSVKAAEAALTPAMTVAEAFRRIALSCLTQFRLNEDLVLALRSEEALHQARVALRRLRSAFTVFKPVLGAETGTDLREGLRWLAQELGQARDLDVLVRRAPPGPLLARLTAEREAAYDTVAHVLGSRRARLLALDLVEWLDHGDWRADPATRSLREMPAPEFAGLALSRFRRKVRKDGKDLVSLPDEQRHELRKDAKKLRYAADFFAPLFQAKALRRKRKRFMDALESLQDSLGALNDLAAGPEVLDRLGLLDLSGAGALVEGGDRAPLLKAAAEAHDRLVGTRRYWPRPGPRD